jgi:hypothetical protein
MSKRLKAIPKFPSEAAERTFWEKNDSTAYLDWSKAQVAAFPNLKPSAYGRPCAASCSMIAADGSSASACKPTAF